MRSPVVALTLIISAALGATPPADKVLLRTDAIPLADRWSRAIEGAPPAIAAVATGRLLVGWPDHFEIYALASGETEWTQPVPAARAACEDTFCVVADDTSIRGVDLAGRAVRWQQPLNAKLGLAPAIRSGWVILASESGDVRALQASDGREVWRFTAGAPLTGAPSINGSRIAIATTQPAVTLLDLAKGTAVWSTILETQPSAPRLGGGRVFVGTEPGRLVTLDDQDGRLRFEYKTGANVTGAPTLDEHHVYTAGFDGVLRAFNRVSGTQEWYTNLATRAAAGPVVDGDLVFVPLRTGAIDIMLSTGKEAGHLPTAGNDTTRLLIPPLIVGEGKSLGIFTLLYDSSDTGRWSLVSVSAGLGLPTNGRPAVIPGSPALLSPPR